MSAWPIKNTKVQHKVLKELEISCRKSFNSKEIPKKRVLDKKTSVKHTRVNTMGKLLSLLARDNSSDCCGPKSSYDIFLDFENAQPSPSEQEVYEEVNRVLVQSDRILEEIQVYKVSERFITEKCEEINKQMRENHKAMRSLNEITFQLTQCEGTTQCVRECRVENKKGES